MSKLFNFSNCRTILKSVRISNPPSENYIRLERLVGRVIVPYLGYLGLYEGSSEPIIRSENYGTVLQRAKKVTDEISLSRAPSLYQKRRPRLKANRPLTLETVSEMTHREHELLSRQLMVDYEYDSRQLMANSGGRQLLSKVEPRRYSCDILM
ncbi:hypothetical protein LSH36_9g10011 [Paralvinella palmiformis]|uniref:Uncharacterized protein n=1 Tax=Paralvinella palmiformis TaxID=53620 RepID=A0AAD9KDY7_9ANNE|nr:hypothetical protein LSH36_9g10011 [Paralvinella palmiformis]